LSARIGFDRKVRANWLDAAAGCAGRGETPSTARTWLAEFVARDPDGDAKGAVAIRKTVTVLLHVWVTPPPALRDFRDRGLDLWSRLPEGDRRVVHWGMCCASYPFFLDVATTVGRLADLQRTARLNDVVSRLAERWGDRSTMRRAAQRVVRSMIEWGCLEETGNRGVYRPAPRSAPATDVAVWMVEGAMRGAGREGVGVDEARALPSLFPFNLDLRTRDFRDRAGVELHREGRDRDVVGVR